MKLPGLRRYLAQSLGFEVQRVESFRGLAGPEVLASPAFKDNLLSFGVAYGLALQGLGKSSLRTNLLPKELVKDRLIREKKPWAVASAAVLLTALTISFVSFSRALGTVSVDKWKDAESKADGSTASETKLHEHPGREREGLSTIWTRSARTWSATWKGGSAGWNCSRRSTSASPGTRRASGRGRQIEKRAELHIHNLEVQRMEKVEDWYAMIKQTDWFVARPAPASVGGARDSPSRPLPPGSDSRPRAAAASRLRGRLQGRRRPRRPRRHSPRGGGPTVRAGSCSSPVITITTSRTRSIPRVRSTSKTR